MSKHGSNHKRVNKDFYPSPPWVVDALAEYIDLRGKSLWECACGTGCMSEALKAAGAKRAFSTDIIDRGYQGFDGVFDFTSDKEPRRLRAIDGTVTNPPWSKAEQFIERGLYRIRRNGGFLALLLLTDFDNGITRPRFFRDCPDYVAKLILTDRPIWYRRTDGEREQPKENVAWYLWGRPVFRVRQRRLPAVIYQQSRATYG